MKFNLKKIKAKYFFILFFAFGISEGILSQENLKEKEEPSFSHETAIQDENKNPNITPIADLIDAFDPDKSKFSKGKEEAGSTENAIAWPKDVTPLQITTMGILQKGFYRPVVSKSKKRPYGKDSQVNLKQITPEKIERYQALGGDIPTLEDQFRSLMDEYSPIRDKERFPESDAPIYSPVARKVLPRKLIFEARETEAVDSLPLEAHVVRPQPETPEQRLARKAQQKADFEATAAQQGIFPQQLNEELENALKPWMPYFNYIERRKKQYLDGTGSKLRWPDLVDAFLNYVAPHMTRLEIDGYEVYFSLENLKFHRKGGAKLNHQLMQAGFCPYGADGKPMNYHHVTKLDPYVHQIKVSDEAKECFEGPYKIVLIPGNIHTKFSGLLHCEDGTYVLPKKDIDRNRFRESRKQFNETIVAQFFHG